MNEKFQKLLTQARDKKWFSRGWPLLSRYFSPPSRKAKDTEFRVLNKSRSQASLVELSKDFSKLGLPPSIAFEYCAALFVATYISAMAETLRIRLNSLTGRRQAVESKFVEFYAEQYSLESYLLEQFQCLSLGNKEPARFLVARKTAQAVTEKFSSLVLFLAAEKGLLQSEESKILLESLSCLLHLIAESSDAYASISVCDVLVGSIGVR